MRNKLTDELAVCGLNAVIALAEYKPEQINRLFLREDRLEMFAELCKNLAERKRPYKFCEDEELERVCKSVHHQGIVAMIHLPLAESLSREELDEWADNGSTGFLLYSVGNDHNLGAIIRAAAFFDVKYIILPEEDAMLSTSAYRVAEGGMEHVTIRTVRNPRAFLREASRKIVSIGADIRARQKIGSLRKIIDDQKKTKRSQGDMDPGIIIVLGNEESGLPPEILEVCSVLVRIPGTGLMDSLNVSQAASLFMYKLYEL